MTKLRTTIPCLLIVAAITALADAGPPPAPRPAPDESRVAPITTDRGPVGQALTGWWREGTAAGNVGDYYDNRDGGHSQLDIAPYPQLERIVYTDEQIARRAHFGGARIIRPHVVFGNSSTSRPLRRGGSNARLYYSSPAGIAFLYQQYVGNNLFVYPEHRDHDVGHNGSGSGGYGDVFPTNTPYLIVSQGSSGSDRPFIRALPFVLAAFRPEVKARLVETGLLMPTVQMVLRSTGRQLAHPEEYLTGKAHPTVFEGEWVDPLAMVEMAHAMRADDLPPMIQLAVLQEDRPRAGIDYFEPGRTERLGDTPAVIARVFRGRGYRRTMRVSAATSYDVNDRPLQYRWVVLRGDAERIEIKPLNEAGSRAEIVVAHHPRRPVAPGSALESNRVDIGVFVFNGRYWSAPGLITWFFLDDETRTYDENARPVDIGCGIGETEVAVVDWTALGTIAGSDSPAARRLGFTGPERDLLVQAAPRHEALRDALTAAEDASKIADAALREVSGEVKAAEENRAAAKKAWSARSRESRIALHEARDELAAAEKRRRAAQRAAQVAREAKDEAAAELERFLNGPREIGGSLAGLVDRAIDDLLDDPDLFDGHDGVAGSVENADHGGRAALDVARRKLVLFGVLEERDGGGLELTPARAGPGPATDRLTACERKLLRQFNAKVATDLLYPGVLEALHRVNFVDPTIAAPKRWRDVYHYDALDDCIGWTRYDGERVQAFDAAGQVVLDRDALDAELAD